MAPAIISDVDAVKPIGEALPTAAPTNATKAPTPKLFSLEGKTVAITGAARGLGITLAIAVVESGGHAACLDILAEPSAAEWAHLTKLAAAHGVTVSYARCDVTAEADVEGAINDIAAKGAEVGAPFWGTIACAGIQQALPALDYPSSDFDRILRVNVTGVFNTCKYAARALRAANSPGSIVIIASMSGQIANRGINCSAYNTSKAACHQMTRSLAQEWGQYGIRINSLSPGYIQTDMTDRLLEAEPEMKLKWMAGAMLGRLGVADDFKAPAVFLLSEGASFVHGADLRADGGHCASA